jgi:hypothetical protein
VLQPVAPAEPFSAGDLWRAAVRPHLLVEYVLGNKDRLASTVSCGSAAWTLAGLLMVASVLATIPYGLLSPTGSAWKVAAVFTWSLLICFPALYVFGQFLGLGLSMGRSLALAMVLAGTAGLFTFGFFPIIWFLTFSIRADAASAVSPRDLSAVLLCVSMLMGIVQMLRCLTACEALSKRFPVAPVVFVPWILLLIFITYRMACLLGVP